MDWASQGYLGHRQTGSIFSLTSPAALLRSPDYKPQGAMMRALCGCVVIGTTRLAFRCHPWLLNIQHPRSMTKALSRSVDARLSILRRRLTHTKCRPTRIITISSAENNYLGLICERCCKEEQVSCPGPPGLISVQLSFRITSLP